MEPVQRGTSSQNPSPNQRTFSTEIFKAPRGPTPRLESAAHDLLPTTESSIREGGGDWSRARTTKCSQKKPKGHVLSRVRSSSRDRCCQIPRRRRKRTVDASSQNENARRGTVRWEQSVPSTGCVWKPASDLCPTASCAATPHDSDSDSFREGLRKAPGRGRERLRDLYFVLDSPIGFVSSLRCGRSIVFRTYSSTCVLWLFHNSARSLFARDSSTTTLKNPTRRASLNRNRQALIRACRRCAPVCAAKRSAKPATQRQSNRLDGFRFLKFKNRADGDLVSRRGKGLESSNDASRGLEGPPRTRSISRVANSETKETRDIQFFFKRDAPRERRR